MLLSSFIFIASRLVFKPKLLTQLNLSGALFLTGLITSLGLILYQLVSYTQTAYDTLHLRAESIKWWPFLRIASLLAFIAMALFVFSFIIARLLTILIFGPRKDLIEMDADNRPYAIVRSALLFVTTVVLLQFFALVFQAFTPEITTPFYR